MYYSSVFVRARSLEEESESVERLVYRRTWVYFSIIKSKEDTHVSYVDLLMALEPANCNIQSLEYSAAPDKAFSFSRRRHPMVIDRSTPSNFRFFIYNTYVYWHHIPTHAVPSYSSHRSSHPSHTYKDSSKLIKHPMLWGIQPLQMFLRTTNHFYCSKII